MSARKISRKVILYVLLLYKKRKSILSVLIYSYNDTRAKLEKRDITAYQHGKCFVILKYYSNMATISL